MHSVFGMLVIVAFAYTVSSSRDHVSWRTVGIAFVIQFAIGGLALFTSWGNRALSAAADATGALLSYSRAGIDFMFGQLAAYDGPIGFVFAVNVLPVVVFFSAFIAVMYHLGVMMWIVRFLGGGLRRLLGTSHAESMSAAANIFVGQAEAPLVVKPFIPTMTRSELFAVMVGGPLDNRRLCYGRLRRPWDTVGIPGYSELHGGTRWSNDGQAHRARDR
jgi:CNT family concentrative nucleoside transporter